MLFYNFVRMLVFRVFNKIIGRLNFVIVIVVVVVLVIAIIVFMERLILFVVIISVILIVNSVMGVVWLRMFMGLLNKCLFWSIIC